MVREKLKIHGNVTTIFRFYIVIYLGFSLLITAITGFHSARQVEPLNVITILANVLLLAYLSWPWLERKLGRAYLPVGLLIIVLASIAERLVLFPAAMTTEEVLIRELAWQWQLTIVLLIPMILVSWQYPYRVTGISVGILTVLSVLGVSPAGAPVSWGVALFRCAIYLLVGYIIRWLQSELRRQNQDLQQVNQLLARQAETREQLAISRERNRMARDLHDTLAHSLTAVAVQLEAVNALWDANPASARQMLEQSLQITRDGLKDARQAILSLRTDPLVDLGLVLSLRTLAISLAERSGSALEMDLPDTVENLPAAVEHSFYRIAEEGLRNISSHANAQHVRMRLRHQNGKLFFQLADDGVGFDQRSGLPQGHFGLRGMYEWAEAIGAGLTVESCPGAGTTIRVEWQEQNDTRFDL